MVRCFILALLSLALSACGNSAPGPLAGTWVTSPIPMKTTFRDGETETMGMIERVEYKRDGSSIVVTYKDGLMKGTSVRFILVDPTTAQALSMTYKKVSN